MIQGQNIKTNIKTEDEERKYSEKKQFFDSLNQYFRFKEKYESALKKDKNQIVKLEGLSWREKRIEYMKIKPKCINCKRPVGSIFSTKVEDDGRHLIALCGDRKTPCPFNININLGVVENIRNSLYNDEKTLNQYKKDVIIDKNDLLFGYISPEEAVEKFDKLKENVTEFTKIYEFTLQTYLNIVDNEEKKSKLEKLQLDFYNNLENFNMMIKQYESTQNTQIIVDAVDLYVNTMQPRANEIISRKYQYNGIEYNNNDNTFHLIQKQNIIENLEWDLTENGQKVVSFKTGSEVASLNKKQRKTVAFSSAIPGIREKIKEEPDDTEREPDKDSKFKLKPQLKIQEDAALMDNEDDNNENDSDNDSDNDSENSDEKKPLQKLRIYPNILPDGSIAASEAHRFNFKIEMIKGELLAKDNKTGETYKVSAGK